MSDNTDRHAGFTLIELMVALVVCVIVLVGARAIMEGLADSTDRMVLAARRTAQTANAEHFMRSLFARLDVAQVGDTTFGGDGRSVHFTTWCETPDAWLERCDATLAVESHQDTNALMVHLRPRGRAGDVGVRTVLLATGFHSATLRYLDDPRAGGHWFIQWGDGIVAPLAIAVVIDGDTSIVRIGERG